MKKIDHSTGAVVVTVLLIGGGMFIFTGIEAYGQEEEQPQQQQQPTSPSTSLSTDQTSEGWMTSFDLENCNFASTGENSYFILKPGYPVILEEWRGTNNYRFK